MNLQGLGNAMLKFWNKETKKTMYLKHGTNCQGHNAGLV